MSAIDLTRIPFPPVIEQLDFDTIFNEMMAEYVADQRQHNPEFSEPLPSDPAYTLIRRFAYRELNNRQHINESAQAVLLAYALNADLDNLVAFQDIERLVIEPADDTVQPPKAAVYESDDALRNRFLLAVDGRSVAGPEAKYRFHGLTADANIKDISVDAPRFARLELNDEQRAVLPNNAIVLIATYDAELSDPMPGDVAITILTHQGNGEPTADNLNNVNNAINAEDVRPLTDRPRLRGSDIIEYRVEAELTLFDGPDQSLVAEEARLKTAEHTDKLHRLDHDVTQSGLYAALHQAGVQNVKLLEPSADIVCANHQAAYCTEIVIRVVGVDV